MTREIPLTKGKIALVDDDMYDYLTQWKWYATDAGYAVRHAYIPREERVEGRRQRLVYMHHVVMGARIQETDHINRDRADNQRHNLRPATREQNTTNRKKRSNTTSKYIGVHLFRHINKWGAQITVNRKHRHLGCFETEIEAARARDKAAHSQYGEFASLNFPEDYQ